MTAPTTARISNGTLSSRVDRACEFISLRPLLLVARVVVWRGRVWDLEFMLEFGFGLVLLVASD